MISIPTHKSVRVDRPTRGGGLITYISNELAPYATFKNEYTIMSKDIEILVILLDKPHNKKRCFINFYRPPKGNIDAAYDKLSNIMEDPALCKYEKTLVGDANIDLNHPYSWKGRKVSLFTENYNLHIVKTGHFRSHPRGGTFIDHIYTQSQICNLYGIINLALSSLKG